MQKLTIAVIGMSCKHCEAAVERALGALDGVEKAEASAKKCEVKVKFDETKTSIDTLRAAIVAAGYNA